MANPGSPGSSGGKNRAYLFLSLILLVWNTIASARLVFEGVSLPCPGHGAQNPSLAVPSDNTLAQPGAVSARRGPPSLPQKYLLGIRVDINLATAEEISELPGISDTVAAAVVAERARRGGFRSHRDLLSVPGIKKKRLEKILPFLSQLENN